MRSETRSFAEFVNVLLKTGDFAELPENKTCTRITSILARREWHFYRHWPRGVGEFRLARLSRIELIHLAASPVATRSFTAFQGQNAYPMLARGVVRFY